MVRGRDPAPLIAGTGRGIDPRGDTGARRERALFRAAFALLCALAGSLALAHRRAPLVDWPEHLAQDAIVAHLREPAWRFGEYYRTTGWFLPYQGFRWLHIALSALLGDALGARAALLVVLLAAPLAALALVRRLHRDRWLALGAFLVLVDGNLLWGFVPHALGTALLLGGAALAIDLLRRGGARRAALLGVLGVALFFTHAQQTALLLATGGAVALVALLRGRARRARVAPLALALAPAALLLGAYLLGAGWISGGALRDEFAISGPTLWHAPLRALRLWPYSAGLTLTGYLPWIAYLAALASVALAALAQRRAGTFARASAPFAPVLALAWAALYFLAPAEYRGQTIAPRLASLALLALLWLPPLARPTGAASPAPRRALWAARAALFLAACASLAWTHARFARFDREVAALDEVLAAIPRGSRVATLVYDTDVPGFRLPVLLHVGGYQVAERGGMGSFGFTRTGVTYAPSVPREMLTVRDLWRPSLQGFQLDLARQGAFYDAVLVVTGARYPGAPFAHTAAPGLRAQRVLARGRFELWRVVREGGGSARGALAEPVGRELGQ